MRKFTLFFVLSMLCVVGTMQAQDDATLKQQEWQRMQQNANADQISNTVQQRNQTLQVGQSIMPDEMQDRFVGDSRSSGASFGASPTGTRNTISNGPAGSASLAAGNVDQTRAPFTFTHSATQAIEAGSGISCNAGGLLSVGDNGWWREFDMAAFGVTDDYMVTSAEFGIEAITTVAPSYPITVNIYSSPTGIAGVLTLQGTAVYNAVDADAGTVVSVPVTAVIPAGEFLIYEVQIVGDGVMAYFPGANDDGQTGPSYISASGCGIFAPADIAGLGFPNSHWVMNIVGHRVIPPIIMCPANIAVFNDPGVCGATVNFGDAVAIDPEGDPVVVAQTMGLPSGSVFPLGVNIVEFTATDIDGETSSCQFTITVSDNEPPMITCQDITVQLDANGDATINATDLLSSSTDNCGIATTTAGSPLGGSGSLTTLFARNNGGAFGGAVYFDVTIGPNDLSITALETNTAEVGAMTMDMYAFIGNSAGNEQNPAPWGAPLATGSGIGAGTDNPSMLTLDNPVTLLANTTYAVALVMDGSHGHDYTNGNGGNQNFANADMAIALGSANNTPFVSGPFSPRVWNGTMIYDIVTGNIPQGATVDFDCDDVGDLMLEVIVTDNTGNSSTCLATVTVEDNVAPIIVCEGEPATLTDTQTEVVGVAIPDSGGGDLVSTMTVTDDETIDDLNVNLDIAHTWVGDLSITLESPGGTVVTIYDRPGVPDTTFGCSGNDIDATLDDEAADPVEDECGGGVPTISGSFMPNNPLSAFDGESTMGDWILTITDNAGGDLGTLNEWGITYEYEVVATPLDVILDANGMATVNVSDLLLSVDEACGWIATTGGGTPVPCDSSNPSNAFENGRGCSINNNWTAANDVIVSMGSDMILSGITPNIFMNPGANASSVEVTIYDDAGGLPGSVIANEVVVPTSETVLGSNFGFDISAVEMDLTPVVLPSDPGMDLTYWVAIQVTTSDGGSAFWEDTSASTIGNFLAFSSGGPFSIPADRDGVYTFTANCVPPILSTLDFTCDDLGENQIEVTVTDDSGNTAMCTATVNVIDDTDPILICMDVTLELGPDGTLDVDPAALLGVAPDTFNAMVIGSDGLAGAGDTDFTVAVTANEVVNFDWDYSTIDDPFWDSFGYVLNGAYTQLTNTVDANQSGNETVNLTAGDTFGFRVASDDNIGGEATAVVSNFMPGFTGQFDPANWVVTLNNSNGDAFFITIPGGPLSFDACGITVLAVDVTEVTCADIGVPITAMVFASDASGNLAACNSVITVVDASGPDIVCPPDQTVDPGPGNLFYDVPDYWGNGDATATDNCTDPVTIFTQDPAPGTELPDGTYTVTLTAEDEYGNVSTCTFELTVESILGVDDLSLDSGVILYPNPARDIVNIANQSNIQLDRATIYDINGRLIQNIDLTDMGGEKAVNVSQLSSGTYMVQIVGETGQTVKRLVKE